MLKTVPQGAQIGMRRVGVASLAFGASKTDV